MAEQSDAAREVAETSANRRGVLGGLIVSVAAAVGYSIGTQTAGAADGVGEVGSEVHPFERVYADSIVFEQRTSDPSGANDGELWYNSDA